MQGQKQGEGTATTHSQRGTNRWVISITLQVHYTTPLAPAGTDAVPIYRTLAGAWRRLEGHGKSRPHRDSIPGPSSPYRVATPTALSGVSLVHVQIKI
jgi:hypothetical protein